MPAAMPTACSECGSGDIRVEDVAARVAEHHREKVLKVAGKYRWMCDACGAAGAVFEDEAKLDALTRPPQPLAVVNAIRVKVGKSELTGEAVPK